MLIETLLLASMVVQEIPAPVMVRGRTDAGVVSVSPEWGISGEFGTWTVSYGVGPGGIDTGGGIRVQLPDVWHSGPRNSANRLQATDPEQEHYVSAHTTRSGVALSTTVESETTMRLVKHAKESLDGRSERYVFVVRVVVRAGRLAEGDRIEVVYGDVGGGSPGYRAGAVASGPRAILLALDARGSNRFQLHANGPLLTARPGAPTALQLHAPSQGQVGRRSRFVVSAVDKENNAVFVPLEVELVAVTGEVENPRRVRMAEGQGHVVFYVTPQEEGVVRLRARVTDSRLESVSNPMLVGETEPPDPLFWGDLHSHTRFSWDGVGDGNFAYARHISVLDFYAMTDHLLLPREEKTRGLSQAHWEEYTALTERHHDPGSFVTLHAYECSLPAPFGHHNIYFRGRPAALFFPSIFTLPEIWAALDDGQALTVPHHTGKFPGGVDFSIHDPGFRRNFELYSAHGLSETFNPDHALSFERSDFTAPSVSLQSPANAQDAWKQGLQLSTLAASDDHRAHPGLPHYGLTAVRASRLTRDAIFQALYDRRTYGTTGAKIILEVTVNGASMGQKTRLLRPTEVTVEAYGTHPIRGIEVLRYQPGQNDFEVVHRWKPGSLDFLGKYADAAVKPGAIYYVRLEQSVPVRGRAAMAWSSPVWIRHDGRQ